MALIRYRTSDAEGMRPCPPLVRGQWSNDITPDDPAELRAVNRLLADEVKSQALLIEKLKHQLAGQNRHRFGVRSESLDQLNLTFEEGAAIAEAAEEQAKPAQPAPEDKSARQRSRKPLPDHLDRQAP